MGQVTHLSIHAQIYSSQELECCLTIEAILFLFVVIVFLSQMNSGIIEMMWSAMGQDVKQVGVYGPEGTISRRIL